LRELAKNTLRGNNMREGSLRRKYLKLQKRIRGGEGRQKIEERWGMEGEEGKRKRKERGGRVRKKLMLEYDLRG